MDIQHDVELLPYNTFHVPARAAHLARFRSLDELRELLSAPELKDLPRLVMGGGSNMLFTRDWPGLVLLNEIEGITVDKMHIRHFALQPVEKFNGIFERDKALR